MVSGGRVMVFVPPGPILRLCALISVNFDVGTGV